MPEGAVSDELGVIYDTPQKVLAAQCSSDAVRNVAHGTHVMGSMAGSGLNGRYVGMAPEADITGGFLPFGPDLTEDIQTRLANYVKKHTAPYKYPRIVEFRDELPKTISGKIRRVALKG